MRRPSCISSVARHALALTALVVAGCEDRESKLSTADIIARAEAYVRDELSLTEDSALFTDVFVPGYEEGKLMVCGAVSGKRPDGPPIAPRRFIAQLEPARWVAWESGNSPHTMPAGFAAAWNDICLNPDDRSEVPLVPE